MRHAWYFHYSARVGGGVPSMVVKDDDLRLSFFLREGCIVVGHMSRNKASAVNNFVHNNCG